MSVRNYNSCHRMKKIFRQFMYPVLNVRAYFFITSAGKKSYIQNTAESSSSQEPSPAFLNQVCLHIQVTEKKKKLIADMYLTLINKRNSFPSHVATEPSFQSVTSIILDQPPFVCGTVQKLYLLYGNVKMNLRFQVIYILYNTLKIVQ